MKKKIIISALALTIGAGLAGSITGTAAWYQYSTKTNAALVGVSGGAAGNLNMRIRKDGQSANQDWTTFISKESLKTYLTNQGYGTNILPVTPSNTADGLMKDDALPLNASGDPDFCANPIPGKGPYETWKRASKANYVVIPLQLRYVERDGVKDTNGIDEENIAKDVYLSDLVLQQPTADTSHNDISEALRFHISTYDSGEATPTKTSRLVSKKGGRIVTNGKLDLDGDGNNDTARASDKYGFNEEVPSTEVIYGKGEQVAYTAETLTAPATDRKYYDNSNTLINDGDVYSLIAQSRTGDYEDDLDDNYLEYDTGKSKSIGKTIASTTHFLNVDITIWVEGWHKFQAIDGEPGYSSIWNKKYIDAAFQIGFEFAINAIAENA